MGVEIKNQLDRVLARAAPAKDFSGLLRRESPVLRSFKPAVLGLSSAALLSACAAASPLFPIEPSSFAQDFYQRRLDASTLDLPDRSSWDLPSLELAALSLNPEIATARAALQAARGATQTAVQRANPSLQLNLERAYRGGAQAWLYGAALDLLLLRTGERERATQIAALDELLAHADFERTLAEVRHALRLAFLDADQAVRETPTLRQRVDARAALLESVRLRTQAGELSGLEQLQAQIDLAEAKAGLGETLALGADARVRLAGAIGVPIEALDAVQLQAPDALDDPAPATLADDDARRQALVRHVEVQRALHEYTKADLDLQAATTQRWPALHIAPGYEWDQGQRKLTLASSFELPIFNRNEGPISEALARRAAAASRLVAAQVQVYERIERARLALMAAQTRVADTATSLALAAQAREAEARRLAAGASDRPGSLAAELTLLEARLQNLHAEHAFKLADVALDDALRLPADAEPQGPAFASIEQTP